LAPLPSVPSITVRALLFLWSSNATCLTSDTSTNHLTLPQAHRLVACIFTPPLTQPASLLKKITNHYPFRFLLPCHSASRLPCPGRGRALPSLLPRAPSIATRLPPSRALVLASGARSAHRMRYSPGRAKPSAALVAVVLAPDAGAGC
jgi:hypothetical protein